MSSCNSLPPGQKEINEFPRFGLSQFARRYRAQFDPLELDVTGELLESVTLNEKDLSLLPRVE